MLGMLKVLGIIILFALTACQKQVSGLNSEEDGFSHIEDCDRQLALDGKRQGDLYWALSNIGCTIYKDGRVDKPATLPVIAKDLEFFGDGTGETSETCALQLTNDVLYSECDQGLLRIGKLQANGNVDIDEKIAINVSIFDERLDKWRRYSEEIDGQAAVFETARIGVAIKNNAHDQ
jgi:hypothetical protein